MSPSLLGRGACATAGEPVQWRSGLMSVRIDRYSAPSACSTSTANPKYRCANADIEIRYARM